MMKKTDTTNPRQQPLKSSKTRVRSIGVLSGAVTRRGELERKKSDREEMEGREEEEEEERSRKREEIGDEGWVGRTG